MWFLACPLAHRPILKAFFSHLPSELLYVLSMMKTMGPRRLRFEHSALRMAWPVFQSMRALSFGVRSALRRNCRMAEGVGAPTTACCMAATDLSYAAVRMPVINRAMAWMVRRWAKFVAPRRKYPKLLLWLRTG